MRTGIGDTLRAARRAQGRSLSDAAAATRVRESYLVALEEERFEALGGDFYARGFLRSYARFLALDPEPLLETFAAHGVRDGAPARSARSRQAHAPTSAHERPAGAAVLLVLLVVVLVAIAFFGLWGERAGAVSAMTVLAASPPRAGARWSW